jgi:hypothetical protein
MDKRVRIGLALLLCLIAGGLRFYRLGDWPFHRDELPTLDEAASLFQPLDHPPTTQLERLPRIVPLGYTLLAAGYECFGRDEYGSRVMGALFGVLNVLFVFLLLDRTLGRSTALVTALLLALWPEHIYRSQENRYYMFASVFASLSMLLGWLAVERQSRWWLLGACVAAMAAVLCQTVLGLLFAGLFVAIVAAGWAAGDFAAARRLLPVLIGAGFVALVFFVVYLLPLMRGWNAGETWGYGLGHSLAAAVSQLGWPIALLALVGAALAVQAGGPANWYWLSWTAVWAGVTLVIPLVAIYHPAYAFPFSLGVLVLAARAVVLVAESLQLRGAVVAGCWMLAACAFNLPSLISHYRDGSCVDFRTAARYVADHWEEGDQVAAFSPTLLKHYSSPEMEPIGISPSQPIRSLEKIAAESKRLWIVVPNSRAGHPEALQQWLGSHCIQPFRARKLRFDYYENVAEVYLYEPPQRRQWGQLDVRPGPSVALSQDGTRP